MSRVVKESKSESQKWGFDKRFGPATFLNLAQLLDINARFPYG